MVFILRLNTRIIMSYCVTEYNKFFTFSRFDCHKFGQLLGKGDMRETVGQVIKISALFSRRYSRCFVFNYFFFQMQTR